jgi:hypothetical protein
MKTLKTININGNNFALPAGMSGKDIQALAGFLCTLTEVGREYDYDTGESIHFESLAGVSVQVSELRVTTKEEAKKLASESRERYHQKRETEKSEQA